MGVIPPMPKPDMTTATKGVPPRPVPRLTRIGTKSERLPLWYRVTVAACVAILVALFWLQILSGVAISVVSPPPALRHVTCYEGGAVVIDMTVEDRNGSTYSVETGERVVISAPACVWTDLDGGSQ